ncbi:MAG: hypothetical protein KC619_09935 [Myxococcales bacterium]|nr:hypothetical protein [Myxococcales bacterium]
MTRHASLAFVLVTTLGASTALADAVGPPPSSCPEGATAVSFCHGPATCEIDECSGDADCASGQVCRPRDLCVVEHCCSGMCCAIDCGSPPTTYDHVSGACAAGRTCSGFGETCETRRVCVAGVATDAGVDGGTDGGAEADAGSDGGADLDAGEGIDAGSDAGTDAGRTDGGSTPADAGGTDAGGSAMDASAPVDAGGGTITGGGCGCHLGPSEGAGGPLAALLLLGLVGWRRR